MSIRRAAALLAGLLPSVAYARTVVVVPVASPDGASDEASALTTQLRRQLAELGPFDRVVPRSIRGGDPWECVETPSCLKGLAADAGADIVLSAVLHPDWEDPLTLYVWERGQGQLVRRSVAPLADIPLSLTAAAAVRELVLGEDAASALAWVRDPPAPQSSPPEERNREEPVRPGPKREERAVVVAVADAPVVDEPVAPEPIADEPVPAAPRRAATPIPARRPASAVAEVAPPPPQATTAPPQPAPTTEKSAPSTSASRVAAPPRTPALAAVAAPPAALIRPAVALGPRHPCTPTTDLGPGRYARLSMVIFPVTVGDPVEKPTAAYHARDPSGATLSDAGALLASVAAGLHAVDFPLRRFDAWHTTARALPGGTSGGELVVERATEAESAALACTDVVVVPHIEDWKVTTLKSKESGTSGYAAELVLMTDIYTRDGGTLRRAHQVVSRVPVVLDRAEDLTQAARASSVDQLGSLAPGATAKMERVEAQLRTAASLLPTEQRSEVTTAIDQAELAVRRVASIERPVTVLPALAGRNPSAAGLGWRRIENECYLDPPTDEKPRHLERELECELLNRVRQAVRDAQVETARIEEFKLFAPVAAGDSARIAATPLGLEEGVRVGDGYFLESDGARVGYARVQALGEGGASAASPSALQVVYGRVPEDAAVAREHPLLGIEVAAWGGVRPARRPDAVIQGEDDTVEIEAGVFAATGALRFDVDLGRTAGWFDWYQINRIERSYAGELHGSSALFGVEKRFLVAPRLYLRAGAALGFNSWSVGTGTMETDEDGDEHEVRASAARLGGDVGTGAIVLLAPSLLLRVDVSARLAGKVTEFELPDTDATLVPETDEGSFDLRNTGLAIGVSTGWTF